MHFRLVVPSICCLLTFLCRHQSSAVLQEDAGFVNLAKKLREVQGKSQVGTRLSEQDVQYLPWPAFYSNTEIKSEQGGSRGMMAVSGQCLKDFYITQTSKEKFAQMMKDSNGRQPSGVMEGNLAWLGAYDECRAITAVTNLTTFHGRYCLAEISVHNPQLENLKIHIGACAPSSCNSQDAQILITPTVRQVLGPNVTVDVTCTVPMPLTGGDIAAIVLCSILGLLVILGTVLDAVFLYWLKPSDTVPDQVTTNGYGSLNTTSDPTEVTERSGLLTGSTDGDLGNLGVKFKLGGQGSRSIVEKILLSFSVITNGRKLFSTPTGSGNLRALNGIRVLSMWWVIQGHTFAFSELFLDNLAILPQVLGRFTFQAVSNATFSVDSFFFLSGLLVAYLTLNALREKQGRLNWVFFIVHRFWRLTPALAFTVMIYSTLFLHTMDGPMVETLLKTDMVTSCNKYWWTPLLYINNFYPSYGDIGKQCVGHTWYLANDMQFYLITPLILIPLYRWRRVGLGIIAFLTFTCLLVTSTVARVYQMCANGCPITHHTTDIYAQHDIIYTKPFTRIAPYLVGMLTGFLLHHTNCRIKINKYLVMLGWAVAAVINLSVLYGLYGLQHGQVFTPDVNALYIGTSRFAWSVGLAWVAIACVTGNGGPVCDILSWRVWAPLGRLTYCAYLFHPFVLYHYYINRRHPVHYTDTELSTIFAGNLALSYGVAFVVSMVIEAPMMALEKLVFKRK